MSLATAERGNKTSDRAKGADRSKTSGRSGKSKTSKGASNSGDGIAAKIAAKVKPKGGRASTRKSTGTTSSTGKSASPSSPRQLSGIAAVPAATIEGIRSLLARPLASYHLILALTFLMTAFGLLMVLSASAVEGYSTTGTAYHLFVTQVVFATLGLITFYVVLRLPIRMLRRLAAPAIIVTTILLMLVLIPGVGTVAQGARRWFVILGFSVQPSELVKLALCVWGAHLLASRMREQAPLKELLIPLVPVGILICLLIILQPNLSTTITIAIIVGALLWFAGLPIKVFSAFAIAGAAVAVVLALVEGYRSNRVMSFLGGLDDPQGAGYQARQALFAQANGGIFGQGLGQSSAKWNYLPNAHNDFIFAIVGEELGLVGGLMVVGLFVLLAFTGFRIARRCTDPFLRLMSAAITVIITAQAFINIGYVVGLLPVTGIQLPLLSAGGTSALTVLAMLGLLASAARHEPEAVAALSSGSPRRVNRWLRLPKPVPFRPSRVDALRTRLDQRRRRSEPAAEQQTRRERRADGRDGHERREHRDSWHRDSRRRREPGLRPMRSNVPVDYRVGYSGSAGNSYRAGSRRAAPGMDRSGRGMPAPRGGVRRGGAGYADPDRWSRY